MTLSERDTILVTGAAGFIGGCMAQFLNYEGVEKLILVDDFSHPEKIANWTTIKKSAIVERDQLFSWLDQNKPKIDYIIHLGARTDTTEFDYRVHEKLNLEYSKAVWNYSVENDIPLIYASSAATYGNGELGYNDDHEIIAQLKPLNPYGISKNEFDIWAISQPRSPKFWAGLKFFNVYGPGEYHKNRMASVIFHSYNLVNSGLRVKLFKSHRADFGDGEQLRDFIYVKDLLKVIKWMMTNALESGLYNLGTGKARSFIDLAGALYTALGRQPDIQFVDMPVDIRDKYQYFTQANMNKLKGAGYPENFYTLEEGVFDYVRNYLVETKLMQDRT